MVPIGTVLAVVALVAHWHSSVDMVSFPALKPLTALLAVPVNHWPNPKNWAQQNYSKWQPSISMVQKVPHARTSCRTRCRQRLDKAMTNTRLWPTKHWLPQLRSLLPLRPVSLQSSVIVNACTYLWEIQGVTCCFQSMVFLEKIQTWKTSKKLSKMEQSAFPS